MASDGISVAIIGGGIGGLAASSLLRVGIAPFGEPGVLVGFDGRQSAARGSYPSTACNNQESRYVNTGSI
jgi:cation diffusion facilitator CzcD-associated flavoprotein CzcO